MKTTRVWGEERRRETRDKWCERVRAWKRAAAVCVARGHRWREEARNEDNSGFGVTEEAISTRDVKKFVVVGSRAGCQQGRALQSH